MNLLSISIRIPRSKSCQSVFLVVFNTQYTMKIVPNYSRCIPYNLVYKPNSCRVQLLNFFNKF